MNKDNPASDNQRGIHILGFSTSNYDAMLKFFKDFGFTVIEKPYGDQLVPFFEEGRGARIQQDGFEFQLEESKTEGVRACFNLALLDYTDSEIERFKTLGYAYQYVQGLCGHFHIFRMPDGGVLVV